MSEAPSAVAVPGLTPTVRGLLWMLLSTALLAAMHAMVRHVSAGLHPFEIAFFRNLFGLLALSPLLLHGGLGAFRTEQPRLQVLRGFTGIVAMLGWFYALSYVPIATATALSFTAAVFASLGAVVFLGEKMRLRRWSAVAVSFVGVLIILRPGSEAFQPGALVVLVSAVMWGGSVVIVKQLSRTDSSVSIVAWMGIMLSVLSIPPALLVWQSPSMEQLGWLCLIGLTGTLGHLTMIQGLRLADTTAVMSVDFARLLWATLLGVVIFSDPLESATWIGGTLIFVSGIYIIYRESRARDEI